MICLAPSERKKGRIVVANRLLSVLVADSDEGFAKGLCDLLETQKDMRSVGVVRSGDLVCAAVEQRRPDVLVMDMVLPALDGLGVLKALQGLSCHRPLVIMASCVGQEVYTRSALRLGASYYLLKPVDGELLLERIRELCALQEAESVLPLPESGGASFVAEAGSLRKRATRLLHDIGIPAHLSGHNYLRDAILLVLEDREAIYHMTKEVYPAIGSKYGKTPGSVEKAIRTALDVAWLRGRTEVLDEIFRFTVSAQKGRPTNSEFVALVADRLELETGNNA